MVAVPFKVSMTLRNARGQVNNIFLTGSDVDGESLEHLSGGTELSLSALQVTISDMIISGLATGDTSQISIFVNGTDTGKRFINAANLGTVISRQVQTMRLTFPPGALILFKQLT